MWFYQEDKLITERAEQDFIKRFIDTAKKKLLSSSSNPIEKCLLLPPDITRFHSGAGVLTQRLYQTLQAENSRIDIDVIPTLGQHRPHSKLDNQNMFGKIIPQKKIFNHHWKKSCTTIGYLEKNDILTHAKSFKNNDWDLIEDIPIDLNKKLLDRRYDLIISIGQVVPHEIFGMANHNKNVFIGLGGEKILSGSQMLASLLGIENNLGQITTPLRGLFNLAEEKYLKHVPLVYLLIVKTKDEHGQLKTTGLYAGQDYHTYLQAAIYARKHNITLFDKPVKKIVAYMGKEFKSTWVSNKAIYRTRLALAKGGVLLVIAPYLDRFGERAEVNNVIKKYGYKNTSTILTAYRQDNKLRRLGNAASHLINGSTENNFTVHYATKKLCKKTIEQIGYQYYPLNKALSLYPPDVLTEGFHRIDDENIYFIPSPSHGLWASQEKYRQTTLINQKYIADMIKIKRKDASHRDSATSKSLTTWEKIFYDNQTYC